VHSDEDCYGRKPSFRLGLLVFLILSNLVVFFFLVGYILVSVFVCFCPFGLWDWFSFLFCPAPVGLEVPEEWSTCLLYFLPPWALVLSIHVVVVPCWSCLFVFRFFYIYNIIGRLIYIIFNFNNSPVSFEFPTEAKVKLCPAQV